MYKSCAAAVAIALMPTGVAGAQALDDPTRPTALEVVEEQLAERSQWRLQSTLLADTRRLAVINGKTVSEGERVDGARLLQVQADRVTLLFEGERIVLRLTETQVKTPQP